MSRTYKVHLDETKLEELEQERATDDGMPEPVSLESAYARGRKAAYVDGDLQSNPYARRTRLHEAWDNGRGDELEEFA